jgi:hypothetical protein
MDIFPNITYFWKISKIFFDETIFVVVILRFIFDEVFFRKNDINLGIQYLSEKSV